MPMGNPSAPMRQQPIPTGNGLFPTGKATIPLGNNENPMGNEPFPTGIAAIPIGDEGFPTRNECVSAVKQRKTKGKAVAGYRPSSVAELLRRMDTPKRWRVDDDF